MTEEEFFAMVAEECVRANSHPAPCAPIEPSINGTSPELQAYLCQMDDPQFLADQTRALVAHIDASSLSR